MNFESFFVGQTACLTKLISGSDVEQFALISTDTNPVHLDAEYAVGTVFGQRIAHGYLVGSLISAVIGTQLPGPGSIYLEQSMRFLKPVYLNDTIRATVTILELVSEKKLIKLETVCAKRNGDNWIPVISGQATVKYV